MSIALQQYGQDTTQSGGRGVPNAISPASDGQSYTQASGVGTASIIAANGLNRIQLTNDSAVNIFFLGTYQYTDVDCYVRINVSAIEVRASVLGRAQDNQTFYRASLQGGTFTIDVFNGGPKTILASAPFTTTANTYYWLHLRIQGFGFAGSNPNNLLANCWLDPLSGSGLTPTGEPDGWMLQASDGTLTSPGNFGFATTPAHTFESATFDCLSVTDCPPPATLPMALLSTSVAQDSASGSINPYGDTYFVASTPPPFPLQLVHDLVGPNAASSTGWGPGTGCRYQLVWNVINPRQGVYDWALLDHAVQLCNANGIRLVYTFDNPPTWALTLDAMGSNATLAGNLTAGQSYTSIPISALPEGAYLPHGYQLTVNWQGGTAENVYIWNPGNTYTASASSIGVSTSKTLQVAWVPANNHSVGEPVREKSQASGQFSIASDMATFASAVATRYNGLNGFGKIDVFQVGNENYDLQQRVQNQGSYNQGSSSPSSWDMSSTFDNGGAILAPTYVAVKAAIGAVSGHSDTPVFACAVRRVGPNGRQHIINWEEGFVQRVLALGGSIDGQDLHFYCGPGRTNWDGTVVDDPTIPTYTDASETVVNAPSIQMEIADLQAVFASHNISPMLACFEMGWDIYDDSGGAKANTTATYSTGTPYTSLAVDTSTWTHGSHSGGVQILDGTPIYIDYLNPGVTEQVYAYGTIASGAASIPITTNPLGSQAAQAAWTPTSTHAVGITVYAQTSTLVISQAMASQFTEDMYDALRLGGATYGFIFTINPSVSNVTTSHTPASAQNTKNFVDTINGTYTYTVAYSMTAQYAVAHPSWPGTPSLGNSLYLTTVLADTPNAWWQLAERSGSTALDSSGNHNDTTLTGTITRGQASGIIGDTSPSTLFAGPSRADVPRLFGGTLINLKQPGAGIVFPVSSNPSAWSNATLEFWALVGASLDWHYIAISNGTNGLLSYLDGTLVPGATIQSLLGLSGTFSIAQVVGWLSAVTTASTLQAVGIYPVQLSATRIAAHYQAGSGYPVGTPFTLYGTNAAASTIATAGKLATATGGSDMPVATKVGTATGFGELCALGTNAVWPALTKLPDTPTGNGWLLDSNLLYNQQLLAGPWAVALTARITLGSAFADLYVRAWAYDHAQLTYTPIGTIEIAGQQLTTTAHLIPFNPAALPTFAFNARQMLYLECWPNITKNNSGSAHAQINLKLSTSGTAGVANDMQVGTPGYVAINVINTAYSVYLAGVPVFVEAGSLTVDSQIGQRSTAQFTMHSTKINSHVAWRSRVAVYDGSGALAFSGYVDTPQETKPGFQRSFDVQVQCIDQHWLAEKRRIFMTFTNVTIGQVVHAIWKAVLQAEGVKIGQIWSGKVPSASLLPSSTLTPSSGGVDKVASVTFYYCTVAEALDELVKQASLSGTPFYWHIDKHKRLWFVPYNAVTNATVIDGSQMDAQNNPPQITRANPLFRTTQYIVESFNNAGPFHKTITGDGKATSWTMDYPLAQAPTITIGGKNQSVGTKGSSTKAQFLWAAGDAVIAQAPKATPLALNVKALITYQGQYRDVAKYTDNGLVGAQAAVDGTTGIIEHAAENPTLAPAAVALKIAKKYVNRYGVNAIQVVYQTRQTGFQHGHWVKMAVPQLDLFGGFLIEKVQASDSQDGYNIYYTLTLIQGPYDSSASYFWKNLLKSKPSANTINVGLSSASGG